MGRNVLFSFFGTSEYAECNYKFEDEQDPCTRSRFVQTAICEYLQKQVSNLELVVFVTKEAEKRNWIDSIGRSHNPLKGLTTYCREIVPDLSVKKVMIPGGQDEEDNWALFNIIRNEIRREDTIYFDITHSFRSIPVIALAVVNYARLIDQAQFGEFYYGLYEPSATVQKVVEFSSMMRLFDWTNGVDQFIRTGDGSKIRELAADEKKRLYQEDKRNERTVGKNDQFNKLKNIARQLDEVGCPFLR